MNVFPCTIESARGVAHALFCAEYFSELEEHGHDLKSFSGQDMTRLIDEVEDDRPLIVLAHLVGILLASFGFSLSIIFHHMGLEDEVSRFAALLDLCLSAEGHGVSLDDSSSTELKRAETILEKLFSDLLPLSPYEGFDDLAREVCAER